MYIVSFELFHIGLIYQLLRYTVLIVVLLESLLCEPETVLFSEWSYLPILIPLATALLVESLGVPVHSENCEVFIRLVLTSEIMSLANWHSVQANQPIQKPITTCKIKYES